MKAIDKDLLNQKKEKINEAKAKMFIKLMAYPSANMRSIYSGLKSYKSSDKI